MGIELCIVPAEFVWNSVYSQIVWRPSVQRLDATWARAPTTWGRRTNANVRGRAKWGAESLARGDSLARMADRRDSPRAGDARNIRGLVTWILSIL